MSVRTCICEHAYKPELTCLCGSADAPHCPKCAEALFWLYSAGLWECLNPACRHRQWRPHPRPKMSATEFNQITYKGALSHPIPLFGLGLAHGCLLYLLNSVPGCVEAFRGWCDRNMKDEIEE